MRKIICYFILLIGSSQAYTIISLHRKVHTICRISSGFFFQDNNKNQILLSAQKPLGLILEEQQEDTSLSVVVVEMDNNGSAAKAGVQVGDVLLAVQNASVEGVSLEQVMVYIKQAPKVVNLRFARQFIDNAKEEERRVP